MTQSQQALLRAYGIRPVKRRGQNFLVDGNLARAIAQDTLAVGKRVLELGAGAGALTAHLLPEAEMVACVEVDRNLCELLGSEFGELENFHLIEGDLARMDWDEAVRSAGPRPVVAGNLPYVLTSKVLFALAELRNDVAGGVFMVQKEVADRLVAQPGGRDFGILAVVMGSVFRIKTIRKVPPTVFWPRPDVDSAVISLIPEGNFSATEFADLVETVKALFGHRRKKLRTLWRTLYGGELQAVDELLTGAGIDPENRPEQIDPAQWRRLAELAHRRK